MQIQPDSQGAAEGLLLLAEHALEASLSDDEVAAASARMHQMLEVVEELNDMWAKDGTAKLWQDAGMERLAIRIGIRHRFDRTNADRRQGIGHASGIGRLYHLG